MPENTKHCTTTLSLLLLLAFWQTSSLAQDEPAPKASPPEQLSVDWFQSRVSKFDLSSFTNLPYFSREYCSKLDSLGRRKDAIEHWNLSFEITAKQGKHSYELLDAAIALNRFDLAEKCLPESGRQRNSMLDKIDIARYKSGEIDELPEFPRGVELMTFYDAMELSDAYLAREQYDKLDEFLSDLKITEENKPEDVAGLIYSRIAKEAREAGDLDKAKTYINKAQQIGGRLFYTGYGINIRHKAIHGVLMDELDRWVSRGEAYRGHMARELLQGLIRELLVIREYEAAAKIAEENLKDPEDTIAALGRIASQRARDGEVGKALGMIRKFQEGRAKDIARLKLAQAMSLSGNQKGATEIMEIVRPKLKESDEYKYHYYAAANLAGSLGRTDLITELVNSAKSEFDKGLRLLQAMDGFIAANAEAEE
ncbi:MAG: hypothetical protein AAF394_05650 [Planctomycetota bacterium]